jgi:hypothetical protein
VATRNDAVAIASNAAEAIRVLNQAIHPAAGWPGLAEPVDVYEVLGALASLADRLQQTASQLTRFIEHQLRGGRLAVAFGTHADDVAAAVGSATDTLEQARVAAAQLAQLLSDSQAAVVAMGPAETDHEAANQVATADRDDFNEKDDT